MNIKMPSFDALNKGEQYAYEDSGYVHRMRTGYYLGCVVKPVPSQSYSDDTEYDKYAVFGTTPTKQINGKYNELVRSCNLVAVYKLVKIDM